MLDEKKHETDTPLFSLKPHLIYWQYFSNCQIEEPSFLNLSSSKKATVTYKGKVELHWY